MEIFSILKIYMSRKKHVIFKHKNTYMEFTMYLDAFEIEFTGACVPKYRVGFEFTVNLFW